MKYGSSNKSSKHMFFYFFKDEYVPDELKLKAEQWKQGTESPDESYLRPFEKSEETSNYSSDIATDDEASSPQLQKIGKRQKAKIIKGNWNIQHYCKKNFCFYNC